MWFFFCWLLLVSVTLFHKKIARLEFKFCQFAWSSRSFFFGERILVERGKRKGFEFIQVYLDSHVLLLGLPNSRRKVLEVLV